MLGVGMTSAAGALAIYKCSVKVHHVFKLIWVGYFRLCKLTRPYWHQHSDRLPAVPCEGAGTASSGRPEQGAGGVQHGEHKHL
jgi:hypothetical protein